MNGNAAYFFFAGCFFAGCFFPGAFGFFLAAAFGTKPITFEFVVT
jgi:hypothetical protein